MQILALDPATNCGWAHSAGGSGTFDLSVRRDESSGMRLLRFKGKLLEIHRTVGFDVVFYEAARHGAPKMQGALVVQSEIQGVMKTTCEELKVDYRPFSPSEIKKFATGKGNANKAAMLEAAKAKWPHFDGDDNEADALWILEMAKRDLGV